MASSNRQRSGSPVVQALEPRQMLAGNGLSATYFDNVDLTGATVARTDAAVNFKWGTGSPDAKIAPYTFSARWTGKVQTKFSETYTFSTISDDGVRLWVNGQLLINKWNNHPPQEDKGTITLAANGSYDIKLEYYQNYGGATIGLYWTSASQAKQIIPQAQLYSGTTTVPPTTPPTVPPPPPPPPPVSPPPVTQQGALRISSNGRYLVNADGSPFFYLADTAWQMPTKVNPAGVDYYFQTRASQGFNVAQVVLVDTTYQRANYAGYTPLVNNNPATPNDNFFKHVDYIVSEAAQNNMYVAMLPTWGVNVADANRRIFNTTTAYSYGKFLGTRYKSAANVIWVLGGDYPVSDSTGYSIWRSMAQGITDGDAGVHLMTFHPSGWKSARDFWVNESWLDFDMTQSAHNRDYAAWNLISASYNRTVVKPVIEAEPNYEDIPGWNFTTRSFSDPIITDYDVRKKAYWEIFAGAAGFAYGNNTVYPFASGWQTALNRPGANQMKHLKQLLLSRAYLTRVPDQSVITSTNYGAPDHIQATRDSAGSFAMVYSGSGKSFTVNMSKITGGSVKAQWFNPRTGQYTLVGTYSNAGSRTFAPPTGGSGQDWVLVLDRV